MYSLIYNNGHREMVREKLYGTNSVGTPRQRLPGTPGTCRRQQRISGGDLRCRCGREIRVGFIRAAPYFGYCNAELRTLDMSSTLPTMAVDAAQKQTKKKIAKDVKDAVSGGAAGGAPSSSSSISTSESAAAPSRRRKPNALQIQRLRAVSVHIHEPNIFDSIYEYVMQIAGFAVEGGKEVSKTVEKMGVKEKLLVAGRAAGKVRAALYV